MPSEQKSSDCDAFRPCSLCARADVPCEPALLGKPARSKTKAVNPHKRSRPHTNGSDDGLTSSVAATRRPSLSPGDGINPDIEGEEIQPAAATRETGAAPISRRGSWLPVDYGESESAMGIARKIYRLASQTIDDHSTSAIPDGGYGTRTPQKRAGDRRIPISTIMGSRFPDQEKICSLLESFFESVHWFSLVIYEPKFRQRLQSIQDGYAYPSEAPFLTLLSMILCMAAWYRSKTGTQESRDGQEWRLWSNDLLKIVESRLVQILDQQSIEAVQTCILLGSHHVYHGRPSLSFSLLGATIKMSHAMGLHRGHTRGSPADIQERKRVWWTIYTWDRFASISYGRPLSINDEDCNVEMPAEIAECPYFTQQSLQQDLPGIMYSPYQTQLSKLYVLASPALKIIFGSLSARSPITSLESKYSSLISEVTHKLLAWRRQLPQHLSLDLTKDVDLGNSDRSYRAHALQSLSLQLTFDNLLIVLHRPFLARQAEHLSTTPGTNAAQHSSPFTPTQSPTMIHGAESIRSQDQLSPGLEKQASSEYWWSAAVRTASITELPQLAQLATNSHLVAFMAINLFHSAIVLVLVALLNPLSDSSQGVKRTITRVFRLQELLGQRSALSSQSSVVLRNLIGLLLRREGEAMLGPVGMATTSTTSQMEQGPGAVEDSTFLSVHDTLCLPLEATINTSQQGMEGPPWPKLNLAQRLNETLASVQQVFPSVPNDMSFLDPTQVLEDDVDAQDNSLPLTQHDMSQTPFSYQDPGGLGNQVDSVDFEGNSLFWLWNSNWSSDPAS
ncbi:Ff.00g054440.m01.CDS01 [Fusarium sp. VM40]|nr:Ff.00g054440.m01.CDS01 [Fusarium sp. VM40]